jgi:hypothetical protein
MIVWSRILRHDALDVGVPDAVHWPVAAAQPIQMVLVRAWQSQQRQMAALSASAELTVSQCPTA